MTDRNSAPQYPLSFKIASACLSVALVFLALEIGLRVHADEYAWRNYSAELADLSRSAYPVEFHRRLGWVPTPNAEASENFWGTTVTTEEDGIRANGQPRPDAPPGSEVMAFGDSFTFGDEVSDHETWPAILERELGRPVRNAGVFGYGFDQIALRFNDLVPRYRPRDAVFSFIPEDIIPRSQLSQRAGVAKPWFEPRGEELVLHAEHIRPMDHREGLGTLRSALGYSYLLNRILRFRPQLRAWWFHGVAPNIQEHYEGAQVACLLLQDVADIARRNQLHRVVLLAQYHPKTPPDRIKVSHRVLRCARDPVFEIVDLRNVIRELPDERQRAYFRNHMTPEGNAFIASEVKAALLRESVH